MFLCKATQSTLIPATKAKNTKGRNEMSLDFVISAENKTKEQRNILMKLTTADALDLLLAEPIAIDDALAKIIEPPKRTPTIRRNKE
jgi:hypothetical protein